MSEHFFGATDKGLLRQNNEDSFFVQPVLRGAMLAACVIDGVGGYEGGEVAARIAHDVLLQYLNLPSGEIPVMMHEAMVAANEEIVAARRANAGLGDMACVATLALVDEAANRFYYIHVGDTRLYLYRDGSLVKLTKDQSFVGFLEDNGRLSEREAMSHLKRNEINKALGFDGQLRGMKDYFDSGSSPFLPGDVLLLCSDGLTDLVTGAEISTVLDGAVPLREKATRLIEAANRAGGKDNITVVLVRHSGSPQKQRAIKPKKKNQPKPGKATPGPVQQEQQVPQPKKKVRRKSWLSSAVLVLAALLTGLLVWKGKDNDMPATATPSPAALQLAALLQNATDSLRLPDSLTQTSISLKDTLNVNSDSLKLFGNGLHLVGDTSSGGVALALSPASRYLVLEDAVIENFEVGIIAKGQTVQLKNVQFINCSVPVLYGFTVPVNTPVNLLIKDSLFQQNDTARTR